MYPVVSHAVANGLLFLCHCDIIGDFFWGVGSLGSDQREHNPNDLETCASYVWWGKLFLYSTFVMLFSAQSTYPLPCNGFSFLFFSFFFFFQTWKLSMQVRFTLLAVKRSRSEKAGFRFSETLVTSARSVA